MTLKTTSQQLNVFAECKKYNTSLWQCPTFLFVIMGLIIIVIILITYYIGFHYISPEMLIMVLMIITTILLIIDYTITASFQRIAEANKMKSEFISIVSHQLRTPLSSLKWSLNLLQSKRLGEINKKQAEYLDIINDSNNRIIDLVDDLLNVNRIEEGRLTIRPEAFSLGEVVEEIIKELTPLAQKNNVVINFSKEKNLPLVYADPNRIKMVIENLIDNAIKYSKEEGNKFANITLKKDKDKVRFTIQDNGVGIPSSLQKQVFHKFFRADNIVKQRTEGMGLGLFIAKGIITLSHGKIDFKSKEGKGSEFWFTLPIKK